ncbi:MAG: RecQ family ATP-dependent DNA helicase [Pirellula sp.]|jgi:ATP-dependent DNA helicase RecQ|nr:RecQ family ATP-dependent DNA helicase [Pirellula sp.]
MHAASPQKILQSRFGFSSFRGFQQQVIDRTLAGGHSLVIMPTGGGKSLCYQIPALTHYESRNESDARPPLTLVLSPLVALMKDQVEALRARGLDVAMINSLLRREERLSSMRAIAQGRYAMLYVTPERFRKQEFLEVLAARQVKLLAVDEAHCISEWGHDFRPDYSRLVEIRKMLGCPTTLALTATATSAVQQDILRQLGVSSFGESLDACQLFHAGIGRPNLHLHIHEVWGVEEKTDQILDVLKRWNHGSGIVYFTLIRSLEAMSQRLQNLGVVHDVYHGDLPRQRRHRVQEAFMSGEMPLVLATNAFGMGIDKKDIRFVLHAEIPGSLEAYYQEIGRAGRDGFDSECVFLYCQEDLLTQMEFARWSNPDADFYHRVYDFLVHDRDQVRAYGMEWLRQRLSHKHKHDRRLETALSMLHRYGLIEDALDLSNVQVNGELPESLASEEARQSKLLRDQRQLYALVEYVKAPDRREFLEEYFA